jgi:hypothetical protein
METEPPQPTLETFELHGRSLQAWQHWLCTDQSTGEPMGNDRVSASRYGSTGADCAWWAIAAEIVYVAASGADDDPEVSLDHLMRLAVNNHDDITSLVYDNWYALPDCLKEMLGSRDDVAALWREAP